MLAGTMSWYRSKVDWWVALLLGLLPLVSVTAGLALLLGGKSSEWPWALAGILLVVVIYLGLVFPMRYGLDDTQLLVRFGLCRQRIPLADISEVYPTHNPLSSPALSLDRLHVQFGPGLTMFVMISPADRDRSLDELARKAGLRREGDRLVRA
jgi:hypothetical protein